MGKGSRRSGDWGDPLQLGGLDLLLHGVGPPIMGKGPCMRGGSPLLQLGDRICCTEWDLHHWVRVLVWGRGGGGSSAVWKTGPAAWLMKSVVWVRRPAARGDLQPG